MSDLLKLIRYPATSGAALLDWTLKLKYHTFPFARRKPTWKVSTPGHVADILTIGGDETGLVGGFPQEGRGSAGFLNISFKRVRLTKKTPCPSIYWGFRGSMQPTPGRFLHDPADGEDPGAGRRVARRVQRVSSPGDRLDRIGIG